MTLAQGISGPRWGLIAPNRSTATSPSASVLGELFEVLRRHLLSSYSVSSGAERALAELEDVVTEASCQGWDGYDAKPVNLDAYSQAQLFLKALPTTARLPEVSADPDGDIAFDWVFGPQKALSVSIGPTGRCSFAWMLGQRRMRGTEWLEHEAIPENIANALSQLARNTLTP
jgi:hypothetical protein